MGKCIVEQSRQDVTLMLHAIGRGESLAAAELLPLVYQDLRRLARHAMAKERPGQTLQPTALVHEAYLRLVQNQGVAWHSRVHFFRAAAQAMRWILVDAARRKATPKHGGGQLTPLSDIDQIAAQAPADDLLALDEALHRLEQCDARKADVVKLRYFAGLSVDETAAALGVTTRTVRRDWLAARAWLWRDIRNTDAPPMQKPQTSPRQTGEAMALRSTFNQEAPV